VRIRLIVLALISFIFSSLAIAQPIPTAQLPDPAKDVLVNDAFKFCVTFENTGNGPGFAPFIDLVIPRDPINGNSPCDGITFISAQVTSTNPGVPLTPEPFVPGGCTSTATTSTHPFDPKVMSPTTLAAGMQLITLSLPFGSYQPAPQPKIMIEVTAKVEAFANVNNPMKIYVRGGFRYGGTTGSGAGIVQTTSNPPGAWQTQTITPRVVILHNTYSGGDQETVPGPNFPQTFTITGDVAPGAVLNGLTLQSCLNSGGVWTGPATIQPPATSGNAGSCFAVNWPTITGTGAGTIVVRRASTINSLFLDAATCSKPITNSAIISNGTWTPADPLDPPLQLSGSPQSPPANTTIQVRALATQKNAHPGPTTPGSTITYDIPVQISDYQRFGALQMVETMSDGLVMVAASLTVNDKVLGVKTLSAFPQNRVTSSGLTPVDGEFKCPALAGGPCTPPGPIISGTIILPSTRYVFDISGALQDAGHSGILTGGCFGGLCSPVGATGTLTISVLVLDGFRFGPHAGMDTYVDKDDPLLNRADFSGTVPGLGGLSCSDDGNSCLAVPSDTLIKEVVAKNGTYLATPTTLGGPNVTVNDTITFRLSKTIPSGDAESLTIQDFYPLPVIHSLSLFPGVPGCSPVPPSLPTLPLPLPNACYSFFSPLFQQPPAITPSNNSVTFDFKTFHDTSNTPRDLAIYTTHKISHDPFADGLQLTNEAQECEKNSYGTTFCQAAIAQFHLQEPYLRIRKGVCGAPCAVMASSGLNGITTGCPSCPSGHFDSASVTGFLGGPSIDADAGDTVHFAIAVDNIGTGPYGAFDIKISDAITPPVFGQINYGSFCVKRGDGNAVTWSIASATQLAQSFTMTITTPNPLPGVNSPSGANVILIMYTVTLKDPNSLHNGCYSNTAHIAHYANEHNGPDFVSAGYAGPDASAQVCVMPRELKKSIVSTSETDPSPSPDPNVPNVVIGEIIEYELSVIVPEGTSSFTMVDHLPPGLQMLATSAATVTGVGFNPGITTVANLPPGSATTPQFTFTNLVNSVSNPICERLNVHFKAQVMNNPSPPLNNDLMQKTNTFSIGNVASNAVIVTIVEPKLTVAKNVTYNNQPGAGYTAQYDIPITNNSDATAFDITIKETLPGCVSLLTPPMLTGTIPLGVTLSGDFTSGFLLSRGLKPNESVNIQFQVHRTCDDCAKLTNTVRVEWTSEPGPQGTANATPGVSCATAGERCGHGNPVNTYFATASASICGQVCGVKFADLDGNGTQNSNEPALQGWPISSGTLSTTTDASGHYCLAILPQIPGISPTICEAVPPQWSSTIPGGTTTQCPAGSVGYTTSPVVANTTTTLNFGNKPQCSAMICGRKTTPAPASLPLGGWTITATGNGPIVTATTAADGTYCMLLFGTGSYIVSEQMKTGWLQTQPLAGSYPVKVICPAKDGDPVVIIGVADPLHVDFANNNVCAHTPCAVGNHCEVGPNNGPVCVRDSR
jgi:fimbrial isopeptide formation D2 family protein